jgi:hypothetical protein
MGMDIIPQGVLVGKEWSEMVNVEVGKYSEDGAYIMIQ